MTLFGRNITPGSAAWLKMAALTLAVFLAESLAITFASHPILYMAIIPAMVPLLTVPLVIVPLRAQQKKLKH